MNNEFINRIFVGDVLEILKTLPDELVDCIITSPPYWAQRDYGVEGQIGLEKTPEEYVEKLVTIFREARRVLKKSGTLWLNLGDTYYGGGFGYGDETDEEFAEKYPKQASNRGTANIEARDRLNKVRSSKHPVLKPKDLVGIPWRVALALQQDGWWLRQDIIWHKINAMPEPVSDRFVKSHEHIFLLAKSPNYYFDNYAVKEPYTEPLNRWGGNILIARGESLWDAGTGHKTYRNRNMRPDPRGRNRRDVWSIPTRPFHGAHFATFPEDLVEPMLLAGCPENGIVLDPFMGSGTVGLVARKLGRYYIGIELNSQYAEMARKRIEEWENAHRSLFDTSLDNRA